MFGQQSITTTTTAQTSANLDILQNSKLQSPPSNAKAFSLFPPSPVETGGRLFLSANDPPQNISSLPIKTSTPSSLATAAPSTLIPSEGRTTKASHDNALPIFFTGAQQQQQKQQQPSDDQEQEPFSSGKRPSMQPTDLTTQSEDGPSVKSTNTDTTSKEDTTESRNNDDSGEIRTIKIFGFPPNLADTLRTHFEKYGRIDSSQHSPGNWLSVLYASPTSATAALKSNRMVIADTFMIGVVLATTNLKPIPSKSLLARTPADQHHHHKQQHVYKSVLPVSEGVFADRSNKKKTAKAATTAVGTGQAGISVVGGPTVATSNRTTIPQTTGWMGFLKDVLFLG